MQVIMLGKLFGSDSEKDKGSTVAKPVEKAPRQPVDRAPWEAKFASAKGDDAALLAFAVECPLIDLKVAAIGDMQGESALKDAEAAFRDHHRRAHREAKQRLEKTQWTRKSRDKAEAIIEDARALREQAELPANKLVELDRAWSALDASVLEPAQIERYAAHWQALSNGMRARGDLLVRTSRWAANAQTVIGEAKRAAREVAEGRTMATTLDMHRDRLAQCLAEAPSGDAALDDSDLHAVAMGQLASLAALAERAAYLEQHAAGPELAPDESAWNAMPAIGETTIAKLVHERFAEWARVARARGDAERAEKDAAHRAEQKALDSARRDRIKTLIAEAEAQLAEGHVAEAITRVKEIDSLQAGHASDKKLGGRVQHLHAEIGRLNQWKQWGGGRARDDLLLEAKVLEAAVAPKDGVPPKLNIRGHAEAIDKLRARWKELDKLGAPSPQPLWHAFDGALKKAFEPVDALQKKLKAQRDENLSKRNALVAELDAFALPAAESAEKPDYKAIARHLDHIDAEWRKLGPLEHTVPKKALEGLQKRLAAAKERLEAPLNDARRVEAMRREKIIAAAKAIDPKARDSISKSRELQNEWQTHAKTLPLARDVENALWRQFKEATDAVFKARDAEFKARQDGFSAIAKVRQELIGKLRDLGPEHGPAYIRSTLSDVDAAWRKAGEPKREEAGRLEAQYRAAKDAAKKLLEGSAAREWHAVCDALAGKLAYVRDVEAGTRMRSDDEWQGLRGLPAVWEKALRARFDGIVEGADPLLLLKLEDALDVPSPPNQSVARRELKLRAMKAAMEGRVAVSVNDADVAAWVASLCKDASLQGEERARFDRVVDALRRKTLRV
jgi:hypothetical protein